MSQTSIRVDNLSWSNIYQNGVLSGSEASHYKLNEMRGKTELLHDLSNEIPLNRIICIPEIKFHKTVGMFLPFSVHFDYISTHKYIVKYRPSSNKGALIVKNYIREDGVEVSTHKYGDALIHKRETCNWSKVTYRKRDTHLWHQGDGSDIDLLEQFTCLKEITDCSIEILFDNIP